MLKDRSIICFGGEDWWYHHPHSKNHLMRRFARVENKVIFVNSISMGLPSLANKDILPKIGRKLKSYAKLAKDTPEGITVVSPVTVPFHGNAAARKLNQTLLITQIGALIKRKKMSRPILWIAIPTAANVIGKFDESCVIYQVSDKYDANSEDHAVDPATIRKLHEQCIERADIVLYSGRKLLDEAILGKEKSYLLEQAVDFGHWAQASSPPYEGGVAPASGDGVVLSPEEKSTRVNAVAENHPVGETPPPLLRKEGSFYLPPDIAGIPHPRIGYFGAIEPWLVDQQLIKLAGEKHPEWNWIFIGNLARGTDFTSMKNVTHIPPVAYDDLPRYAAGFDVCVLPWETEHAFTSYGSAIKVREYLATGKPVVISPLPEYEHMSDVLRIARSRDEFISLVEDALAEKDPTLAQKRQDAVMDGTWDARAEWVSGLIEKVLAKP